jgi:hypothetical protein
MSQYEIEKSAPMATQIGSIANHVERFFAFIRERHAVYHRRAAGNPRPWTDDPILREYSFCNIYREFDRTTRWIAENWRTPHATDPDLFFAMGIARLVNLPETLAELGYPVPWNAEHFLAVLGDRKARDERMYSGAYILGTGGRGGYGEKPDYQAQAIFAPLWRARDRLRPRAGESLREFHNRLGDFHGMGGFITAQVIADLKYAEPLRSALDWETYAASGDSTWCSAGRRIRGGTSYAGATLWPSSASRRGRCSRLPAWTCRTRRTCRTACANSRSTSGRGSAEECRSGDSSRMMGATPLAA